MLAQAEKLSLNLRKIIELYVHPDPALFEQEFESGCIPKIQEGGPPMQEYEGSQQEDKDVEIPYSVHGLPACLEFTEAANLQAHIPKRGIFVNGEGSNRKPLGEE
jgi:hypothetical protein